VLAGFDRAVAQVAERLEKEVLPLVVEGDQDLWIDPRANGPFLRSLVHVFRNAVAHGIEDPESRLRAGKSTAGRIACSVRRTEGGAEITVGDDGAGLDAGAIRRRAAALGLLPAADGGAPSDEAVLSLIFEDSFSSGRSVNEISGRGIGLAAVRAEIRRLGGDVTVRSTPGQGTEFVFRLPIAGTAA
jgi:chemotaxis protein histidine kinase CheA